MFIHGYIPKPKKRSIPKLKKLQHEEWLLSINSMSTNFSRNKSTKVSTKFPSPAIPAGRETPKGDKMKGIGTMHKSNAVPIFTDNEAKEISSMRR